MSTATVFWAVRVKDGWSDMEGELTFVKAKRQLFQHRSDALSQAAEWDDECNARLAKITRRPKPKPVSREVLETHAVTYADHAAHLPSLGLTNKVCTWLAAHDGAHVRVTLEVLP